MAISKLYSIKEGGNLSPKDCERINQELAEVNVSEIPDDQIENVKDYLSSALNINSVEHSLVNKLCPFGKPA